MTGSCAPQERFKLKTIALVWAPFAPGILIANIFVPKSCSRSRYGTETSDASSEDMEPVSNTHPPIGAGPVPASAGRCLRGAACVPDDRVVLQTCMFPPSSIPGPFANTAADGSTLKKKWGAHRLEDENRQLAHIRDVDGPCSLRGRKPSDIGSDRQVSVIAGIFRTGATAMTIHDPLRSTSWALSRGTTDSVRRH